MLGTELAFYVGCINLHDKILEMGEPVCFPAGAPATPQTLYAEGLYDVCLALRSDDSVVGNDLQADNKSLVIVTGANQGGKSTFLRSVGLAQLMMQAGMFVPATSFRANVCKRVFTHFKREEDRAMKSGKFDEELQRMSNIASEIAPDCLLLCNESFASTNEQEGSEIGREVVRALADAGVKVVFVTHLFELARSLYTEELGTVLFLRAERLADGRRTFRLVEGEPLPTSYGEDSYWRVFGARSGTVPCGA
jgi:DNA mismatch repair ATPase MutS